MGIEPIHSGNQLRQLHRRPKAKFARPFDELTIKRQQRIVLPCSGEVVRILELKPRLRQTHGLGQAHCILDIHIWQRCQIKQRAQNQIALKPINALDRKSVV